MTYDQASLLANTATNQLADLFGAWISSGAVIALVPGATAKEDDGYSPWVEVLVHQEADPSDRLDMMLTARSVMNTGVTIIFAAGPEITGPVSPSRH